MTNNTINKQDTLERLLRGVDTLVDVVKTTAGSKGHTILIEKEGNVPYITKDGVTVAKSISCADPVENMGCKLVQQAAQLTVEQSGDATTATCVMAQALVQKIVESKEQDHRKLFREIEEATEEILKLLKADKKKVKTLRDCIRIATISTNDKDLGELVGQVMWDARKNGVVLFELSENGETYVFQESGSRYEKMYDQKDFLGATGTRVVYDNPLILNLNEDVVNIEGIITALEDSKEQNRGLVIFAPNYSKMVIEILKFNSIKNGYKVLPLYTPGYGEERTEFYRDIEALVSEDNVDRIIATKQDFTIFTKTVTQSLQNRIDILSHQATVEKQRYYKEKIEKRLSILSQKVFTIYAGATSEIEQNELKDRMEDGLLATRAALEDGYVLGGGLALRNIARDLIKDTEGVKILVDVITSPYFQILQNAGIMDNDFYIFQSEQGINTTTMKLEDFYKSGIIDPYRVVESSLKNAVSVAKTIISLNGTVIYRKDDSKTQELQGGE